MGVFECVGHGYDLRIVVRLGSLHLAAWTGSRQGASTLQVFPLDASAAARIVAPRANITVGWTEFVYTLPMYRSN
jgi:hypothetical protein